MKNFLISILFLASFNSFGKIIEVFDVRTQKPINFSEFIKNLPSSGHIILGEFHNITPIQLAQSEIIQSKLDLEGLQKNFSVHWEFLNHTDQNNINEFFIKFKNEEINFDELIKNISNPSNHTYAPIFRILKKYNGDLFGINLPRTIKQKVIKDGIGSIDQTLIPYHHYVGGEKYKQRFVNAMGGHAPTDLINKYFLAQCLTDSVMADQIIKNEELNPLNFIIAGSFHTDFFDGTTTRLQSLTKQNIVTIKLIEKSMHSQEELESLKKPNEKYGAIADFIVIAE